MKNPEDVIEPRSEYGNLPLELRAMNEAMKMVFNAVTNAAPQAGQDLGTATPSNEGHAAGPAVAAPRRLDIEKAIMRAPGFDYNLAWEIFAALQARLESRYENNLNEKVAEAMKALDRALAQA